MRRQRLREAGNHVWKDVYENYPGVFEDDKDLDAMAKMLDKERKDVRSWANNKLQHEMLARAMNLSVKLDGKRVNRFSDIRKSWKEDGSDENARRMYQIMFGDYEGSSASWSQEWEKEYMSKLDRKYIEDPANSEEDKNNGCYRTQITSCKGAQVKNITRDVDWKLVMACPKEYKGTRTGRRKRGDFYLTNSVSTVAAGVIIS